MYASCCAMSGYDGGDCCSCTCVSANFECGTGSNGGFACRDPSAQCVEDDDDVSTFTQLGASSTTPPEATNNSSQCVSDFFADGDCDLFNNNEECGGSRLGTQ